MQRADLSDSSRRGLPSASFFKIKFNLTFESGLLYNNDGMNNRTVTLSKTEYRKLKAQAKAYQKIMSKFFEFALKGSIKEVVEDFRRTNLYSEEFLKDLESGLRKSSYFKKHGNKTS